MSPVAGTTRYLCPLECGWHHDVLPPTAERVAELGVAVDLSALSPSAAVNAMATRAYLREAERTETALREHLDTHTTEQYVRTIQGLRAEIASLKSSEEAAG
jgi:hypothetical protein